MGRGAEETWTEVFDVSEKTELEASFPPGGNSVTVTFDALLYHNEDHPDWIQNLFFLRTAKRGYAGPTLGHCIVRGGDRKVLRAAHLYGVASRGSMVKRSNRTTWPWGEWVHVLYVFDVEEEGGYLRVGTLGAEEIFLDATPGSSLPETLYLTIGDNTTSPGKKEKHAAWGAGSLVKNLKIEVGYPGDTVEPEEPPSPPVFDPVKECDKARVRELRNVIEWALSRISELES